MCISPHSKPLVLNRDHCAALNEGSSGGEQTVRYDTACVTELGNSGKESLFTTLRRIEGEGIQLHQFLTSGLDGGVWVTSRPGRFNSGKRPGYPLNRKRRGPYSPYGLLERRERSFPYWKSNTEPSGPQTQSLHLLS
jgi:hypothetical protein